MDIFFDESGDVGWGLGGSRCIVLCAMATDSPQQVKRAVKRAKKKHRIPADVELHASQMQPRIMEDLLRRLADLPIEIRATIINKSKVVPRLRENPNILYNYACRWALCQHIAAQTQVRLFMDSRITRVARSAESLPDYLRTQIWGEIGSDVDLEILMSDSAHVLGLQAVDAVANAIFKKHERGETWAYDLIRKRMADEFVLFRD